MKNSFGARRVPRKIGRQDLDSPPLDPTDNQTLTDEPVVVVSVKRPLNKARKSFPVRTPYALDHDDGPESVVVTPKQSTLLKTAVHRPPFHRAESDERPSYSKTHLQKLKQSTPSTPKPPLTDVASKFGTDISRYDLPVTIPSATEIQEKKARRARMAKQQHFISLDNHDDDDKPPPTDGNESDQNVTHDHNGRLILRPLEKYPETRLVRDDEHMYEGFDEYTEPTTNLTTAAATERCETLAKRKEMADLIAASVESDSSDSSEALRNAAFETAQTRHGTYATARRGPDPVVDPHMTPPRISPLPTLQSVLTRLRDRLQGMQIRRAALCKHIQLGAAEKAAFETDEERIQTSLRETGDRFRLLREGLGESADQQQQQSVAFVGRPIGSVPLPLSDSD